MLRLFHTQSAHDGSTARAPGSRTTSAVPAATSGIGVGTSPRHSFVIKSLGRLPGIFQPHRHVYVCLRCKWSFIVNDGRRGVTTAVDRDLNPIASAEASQRLATFANGPCPSLDILHRMPPEPSAAPDRPALRLAIAEKVKARVAKREFRFPV